MWPERTHKIRRILLSVWRESSIPSSSIHLSVSSSAVSVSLPAHSRSRPHLYSLPLTLGFPKKPTLLADWLRGWHCGLPMVLDRKPIRNRRSLSFSQDYIDVEERSASMHQTDTETRSIRSYLWGMRTQSRWQLIPLFVNSAKRLIRDTSFGRNGLNSILLCYFIRTHLVTLIFINICYLY